MNEADTRAELIDPLLAAAGWGVVEGSRIRREFPITQGRLEGRGRRGKPLTADYVLYHRNIQLAVVEASPTPHPWAKALARPSCGIRPNKPVRPTPAQGEWQQCTTAPRPWLTTKP